MHDITHWVTESVNLLLAFQQVPESFGRSRFIINIPFFTATVKAWYILGSSEQNEEKSD